MYHGNTASTNAGWPRNQIRVISQNTRLRTAMTGAGQHQVEPKEAAESDGPEQLHGSPDLHQPGLQIALVPPRALPDPVDGVAVGLLERIGVDDGGVVSARGDA